MSDYTPDVKLKAIVNLPAFLSGRTAIAVESVSGRAYLDLDFSELVQLANVPSGDIPATLQLVWNSTTSAFSLIPYSLSATAGVASLGSKIGALDIGNGLQFTGETLELLPSNVIYMTGLTTSGDNGPAINTAIAALPEGGRLVLPPTQITFATPIDLDGKTNIHIIGQGTQTGGADSGTALRFTGAGFVDAISMQGQNVGCSFKDIELAYNNPLFTGHLVSIGNGAAAGTGLQRFENVTFADDSGAHTAEALVYLGGGTQNVSFRNATFNGGTVRGKDADDSDHFANVINFHMCAFTGNDSPAIEFGGEAWKFDTCNFEPLAGGGLGAYAGSTLVPAIGVTFDNCWFGDATASGTWIAYFGTGLIVTGGRMGADHSGSQYGIRLTGAEGNTIFGVSFEGLTAAIDFDNSAVAATSVFNNKFINCDAEIANFSSRGSAVVCYANSSRTELDPAVGSVTWDPPSLTTGTQTNTAVTVTGALVGDRVEISFGLALQGLVLSGYVSGVDTVFVNLRNDTGGTVDLASGTLKVQATKW